MAARNEFIKNGFKKTSMRTISAKSGIVLGNIYNYFKTKDDIFMLFSNLYLPSYMKEWLPIT